MTTNSKYTYTKCHDKMDTSLMATSDRDFILTSYSLNKT